MAGSFHRQVFETDQSYCVTKIVSIEIVKTVVETTVLSIASFDACLLC